MKPNITIPANLYKQLYNEIMCQEFNPEDEDDNKCYIDEIVIGKFTLNVVAYFNLEYVDDSFSHAFGIEEGHHYEASELEDLDIESVWYYDEDTDYEEDVTEQFDMKAFWGAV